MRCIQFVVLAVLAILVSLEPLNICDYMTVVDWANCTCDDIELNEGKYYCDGLNLSVTYYESEDDFNVTKMVISCDEPLSSTQNLLKLGEVYSDVILRLNNCLSSDVTIGDFIDNFDISKIPNFFLEGKVKTLERDQFANLTNVKQVGLVYLGLSRLDPYVFGDEDALDSSITELHLTSNGITELDNRVFNKLKRLEILALSYNFLTTLPDDIFVNNKALTKLAIANNKLESFSSKLLRNQAKLKELHLSYNRLKQLSGEWIGLDSLWYLLLSHNQLTNVGEGEDSVMRHLHKLEYLLLYNNNLTRLYRDWARLESIRIIDLTNNYINTLRVDHFSGVTHDFFINISENNITEVFMDSFQPGSSNNTSKAVVTVPMHDNPLICDCHLHSFVKYTKGDSSVSFPNVHFRFNPRRVLACGSPPALKDRLIKDLPLEELTCPIIGGCPSHCSCYYLPEGSYTVVNCSGVGLDRGPLSLPVNTNSNVTRLILSHNQLVQFTYTADLWPDVTELDLSNTSLTSFTVSGGTGPLKKLDISYNQLTSLSNDTVRHLQSLESLSLHHNPWLCCVNRQLVSLINHSGNESAPLVDDMFCADEGS